MKPISALSFACVVLAVSDVALAQPSSGSAKAYPSKPVRLVVAFAPGGPADILARLVGAKLSEALREQVVVENRAGAGGIIGTDFVAKSAPDGYTLLSISSGFAISAGLHSKLPFDPIKDFSPVILMVTVPSVLAIHPSLPVNSVKVLVALAKAKPNELTFPSSGIGSVSHLAGELFKSMSGVQLVHVPYKGTGPALIGLLSGETHLMFSNVLPVLNHIKAGKLKPLAVTDAKRAAILPHLPTIAEAGVPGYEATGWFGIVAPAATPKAIVDGLQAKISGILSNSEMKERLMRDGAQPVASTPEEFASIIKTDVGKWTKVIRSAGIKPE